jgi:hypothetical protein
MKNNQPLIWSLRILVAILFVFSAATKLIPVESFEKQLVDQGITNWCFAPILARCIISAEFFLGIAFLQNHYFKKFILPATVLMLVAFCMHLSYQIYTEGNNSNCGCMGQVLPMTPLQAITKNIITLIILGFVYVCTPKKKDSLHRYPLIILIACFAGVFLCYKPVCGCDLFQENKTNITIPSSVLPVTDNQTTENSLPKDTLKTDTKKDNKKTDKTTGTKKGTTSDQTIETKIPVTEEIKTPALQRTTSVFSSYTSFSNGVTANVDAGKSIVCLFNSDCDHCMATAKQLCELNKESKLPPVYILFWGEESQAANFFQFAGCTFPYKFIEAGQFFRLLDKAPAPPRVVVLNEGHIMGDFTSETFNKTALKEAINK